MKILMYSLYSCDEWRSTESMRLEFETLDKTAMNQKICEIICEDYYDLEEKLIDENINIYRDNLIEKVQNQSIDYLYIEIREINLKDKTVTIVA